MVVRIQSYVLACQHFHSLQIRRVESILMQKLLTYSEKKIFQN